MKTKVLLADDSVLVRRAIVGLLGKESGSSAEAADFAQTVQMISDFKPDVLLDLHVADKCDGRNCVGESGACWRTRPGDLLCLR